MARTKPIDEQTPCHFEVNDWKKEQTKVMFSRSLRRLLPKFIRGRKTYTPASGSSGLFSLLPRANRASAVTDEYYRIEVDLHSLKVFHHCASLLAIENAGLLSRQTSCSRSIEQFANGEYPFALFHRCQYSFPSNGTENQYIEVLRRSIITDPSWSKVSNDHLRAHRRIKR